MSRVLCVYRYSWKCIERREKSDEREHVSVSRRGPALGDLRRLGGQGSSTGCRNFAFSTTRAP
eukprot:716847-Prymnesium_polylepis.1